jgi:hypothetical protein
MTRYPPAALLLAASLLAVVAPSVRADQFSLVAIDPPVRVVPGFGPPCSGPA